MITKNKWIDTLNSKFKAFYTAQPCFAAAIFLFAALVGPDMPFLFGLCRTILLLVKFNLHLQLLGMTISRVLISLFIRPVYSAMQSMLHFPNCIQATRTEPTRIAIQTDCKHTRADPNLKTVYTESQAVVGLQMTVLSNEHFQYITLIQTSQHSS